MFVVNGIAHASEPTQGMKVVDVRVTGTGIMIIGFSTGEKRLFDVTPLLALPAFAPLADSTAFENYRLDHGVLTWCDGAIDIATETLYSKSFEYTEVA